MFKQSFYINPPDFNRPPLSEQDFPLEVIPNNMGINLCNVESIEQIKQNDGQFVSVLINFRPYLKESNFSDKLKELTLENAEFKSNLIRRIDASKPLENKLKSALRDFYNQVNKHSPTIETAMSISEGLTRRIQSSFSVGNKTANFHYYLIQFENRKLEHNDIIVTASFHKDGKKCVEFDIFKIKFFTNGYQNEIEWLKGFDFLSKYA